MAAPDARDLTEKILEKMRIAALVHIDSEEPIALSIESSDSAILIGKHGDHLRALQQIINTLHRRQFPDDGFVGIDIAGYKKERIEKVQAIAEEAAEKVRQGSDEVVLKPMNSFERRHVHTLLANEEDIITESEGDGLTRHIVVKKRP